MRFVGATIVSSSKKSHSCAKIAGGCFVKHPYGIVIASHEEQRSSQLFSKVPSKIEIVNSANHIAARKLLECKAHRSGPGAGDLTIVKPHTRSNAAVNYFRRCKYRKGERMIAFAFSISLRSDSFLNLRSLTNSAAQVVQLCTSDLTTTDSVNSYYVGRVDGESLFNTAAVRNSSYSKGSGDTCTVLSDNGTLEKLDSLSGTLFDLVVNTYGVTNVDRRNFCLQLLVCKSLDQIHFDGPPYIIGCSCEHAADHPF